MIRIDFEGYERQELGERGVSFIRERLEWNRTLARLVLERGDLDAGRVFTYLPEGTGEQIDPDDLYQFRESILPNQPPIHWSESGGIQAVPNLDHLLIPILQRWLTANPNHLVIFEEPFLTARDRRGQFNSTVPMWFHSDDVYYPLSHDDRDEETIKRVLGAATWLYGLGFLTSLPAGAELSDDLGDLSDGTIRRLAERVEAIVVDAYDGEGFLIWSAIELSGTDTETELE